MLHETIFVLFQMKPSKLAYFDFSVFTSVLNNDTFSTA